MIDFPSNPTAGQIFQAAGLTFIWDGVKWKALAPLPSNNVGRNILHNGLFRINQRGLGAFTANGYNSDRWYNQFGTTGGSCSVTIGAMTASTAAAFNDESAEYNLAYANTAGTGAGDYSILSQPVEDVRRLSGKTVTYSFWAWCSAGAPKLGVETYQVFGTGGSPSAGVSTPAGAVTLTANTPIRFSVPINIPSVAGKTFGSNAGTDATYVSLWLSAGSNFATRSSNIGFQSNTFLFWGMQLELGNAPSPLEKLDPRLDLANAQRFFQACQVYGGFYQVAGSNAFCATALPVTMRAQPTMTITSNNNSNLGTLSIGANQYIATAVAPAVASAAVLFNLGATLSADL